MQTSSLAPNPKAEDLKILAPTYDILNCGPHNRFSANGKLVHNSNGYNQQNLPAGRDGKPAYLRMAIEAPAGYKILVRDLSGIEARMLAWLANHHELLDIFRNNGDPYCWFATRLFNREITKADRLERMLGKISVLGLGYSMGKLKFWSLMNSGPLGMPPIPTTEERAAEIVALYRAVNWPITNYWAECQDVLHAMLDTRTDFNFGPLRIKHQEFWSPCGLPVRFKNLRVTEDGMKYDTRTGPKYIYSGKMTENITQHLARVVLMEQHRSFMRWVETNNIDGRFAHQVHDELIYVVRDEQAEGAYHRLGEIMSTPPTWAAGLPLDSEGEIAATYS